MFLFHLSLCASERAQKQLKWEFNNTTTSWEFTVNQWVLFIHYLIQYSNQVWDKYCCPCATDEWTEAQRTLYDSSRFKRLLRGMPIIHTSAFWTLKPVCLTHVSLSPQSKPALVGFKFIPHIWKACTSWEFRGLTEVWKPLWSACHRRLRFLFL